MEISELGTPMRAPIEAYIKRRGLLLLPRHRPESRFPDNVQSLKKAENSRFQHFQPLMGVWELGTYMQETQKEIHQHSWWFFTCGHKGLLLLAAR